nr:hypothetical protein CFP56_39247 [Quercus suber]
MQYTKARALGHISDFTQSLIPNSQNLTEKDTGERRKKLVRRICPPLTDQVLDFNCVGIKRGSPDSRASETVEELCGLVDLGFVGSVFTWNNGHEGNAFVQERLDRACAMVDWREMFSHGKVTHLTASYSDHISILHTTQEPNQPPRRKRTPRRFEEKWACHLDCGNVIQHAWGSMDPNGSPMFRLFTKIKTCKLALVEWSRNTFGNLKALL